ncbi:MAG: hypothetical protein ACYC9S_11610 [Leptospirales bacterium]
MGILPTVNVQQVVEQLPAIVQQGATVEIPPRGTLTPPEGILDVVEIQSVLPVRRVDESDGTSPKRKDGQDRSRKKKVRNTESSPESGRVLDVKA